MKEQQAARAYAHSVLELAKDQKIDVAKELTDFNLLINSSNNLENVLFLDIFTVDEKTSVLEDIFSKTSSSALLKNFIRFLNQEKRLGLFPLVYKEIIVIDDHQKGFLRGVIEGVGQDIKSSVKADLVKYLEKRLNKKVDLEYRQSDNISAGYRVNVEDLQLDATVENQLDQIRQDCLTE